MVFDYPDQASTIDDVARRPATTAGSGTSASSTAPRERHVRLGWLDNGTKVTVMYTLYGDANLDGTVNGADLNIVLSNTTRPA